MKNYHYLFIALLGAAALCGCTKESSAEVDTLDTRAVCFKSEITTRVDTAGFETSDEISVAAYDGSTAVASNTSYSYDGALFSSTTPIEYQTSDQELSFYAIYPSREGDIMSFDFTVAADQSTDDAYELSDLLSSALSPTTERMPELSFYHRMSNVTFNIITDESFESSTLTLNAMNNATCDLLNSTFTATGESTTITSAKNSDLGFKAILAPQTVATDTTFATFTLGDRTYEWTLTEDLIFGSGRQYIYNWDIITNKVTLTGIINEWGDSDDEDMGSDIAYTRLKDFSATSYPTDSDEWIIYDTYATTDDFEGMRYALNAISSEGDREISIGFLNLTYIPSSAFYLKSYSTTCLTRVSLPEVALIDGSAFYSCSSLVSVSSPKLASIGDISFYGCSSLSSVDTSGVYAIGEKAFENAGIESLSFDSLAVVTEYAFYGASKLKYLSLPTATKIYGSAFSGCSSLQELNIPEVTYIYGYDIFKSCSSLVSLSIPKVTYISGTGAYYAITMDNLRYLSIATESKLTTLYNSFNTAITSTIALTIGAENAEFVDGNTITVTDGFTYTFYSITIAE